MNRTLDNAPNRFTQRLDGVIGMLGVGTCVMFLGYSHVAADILPVFLPGDLIIIMLVERDGVFRACLADGDGQPIVEISDTLFSEEFSRSPWPVWVG